MLCHKMSEVLVSNAFLGQSEMSRSRLFVCEFVCICTFLLVSTLGLDMHIQ